MQRNDLIKLIMVSKLPEFENSSSDWLYGLHQMANGTSRVISVSHIGFVCGRNISLRIPYENLDEVSHGYNLTKSDLSALDRHESSLDIYVIYADPYTIKDEDPAVRRKAVKFVAPLEGMNIEFDEDIMRSHIKYKPSIMCFRNILPEDSFSLMHSKGHHMDIARDLVSSKLFEDSFLVKEKEIIVEKPKAIVESLEHTFYNMTDIIYRG